MSVGFSAEKFNIASNNHRRTHKCDFSIFDRKCPFRITLIKKVKIVSLTLNLVPRLTNGDIHFFRFWLEIPALGKLGPKNQNCQFKLKFGTYTNSNMQNSMVEFVLFVLHWKYPFWVNLVQKIEIVSLSWNVVPRLMRICRIQWRCSLFLY